MNHTRRPFARRTVVNLFVSYAHEDSFWMQRLIPLLRFPGVNVRPWNDKEIEPGQRWDTEIKAALAEMDVFIPLVSVNFAVSRYINKVEYPTAKQRHTAKEIEVAPVIIDTPGKGECAWLMKLQRLPPDAKSWAQVLHEFPHHDRALAPIRDGIKAVVERARARKCATP